jgi:tetratricopeptide (TPR) repeat protein
MISRRPHCWQPYWWLATWYYRHGRIGEAAYAYRGMIRHAPDLYRGYAYLGGILVFTGAYDEAIDTLKLSIALRPEAAAFDNLGTAYFNSGRLEGAVAAYNQALQFGFANSVMWFNLGDAYYYLRERRDQAAEAYGQALRLAHEETAQRERTGLTADVMITATLSTVFPKLDQPDSARFYLASALRADSTNARVQCCAAITWWELGDRRRAIAWIEKAVRTGYPVAWIRDSPVFMEWRAEEAFRALIAGAGPPRQQSQSPGKAGRT